MKLTAETMLPFVCWAAWSAKDPKVEEEIDTAKGDEPALDALFVKLPEFWQSDGTLTNTSLMIIGQLSDPMAADRLNAYVWKPIPKDANGDLSAAGLSVGVYETFATDALACINNPQSWSMIEKIGMSHPYPSVLGEAANRLLHRADATFYERFCRFYSGVWACPSC